MDGSPDEQAMEDDQDIEAALPDPSVDVELSGQEKPVAELQGYELVASLMSRQDQVILELDKLDKRIESMIEALAAERAARKSQLEVEESQAEVTRQNAEIGDFLSPSPVVSTKKQPSQIGKAA